MANLENYQLVHPELLTEDTLLEVLKDRCIRVPELKLTNKAELVEIYKRVALPLPQRKYDNTRYLGRKLIGLRVTRGIEEAALQNNAPISSMTVESTSKNNGCGPNRGERIVERLKPPVTITRIESKKIRLSKSSTDKKSPTYDINKRKSEENLEDQSSTGFKKRQKITWP